MQQAPPVQQSARREVALAVLMNAVAARIMSRYFMCILRLSFPVPPPSERARPTQLNERRSRGRHSGLMAEEIQSGRKGGKSLRNREGRDQTQPGRDKKAEPKKTGRATLLIRNRRRALVAAILRRRARFHQGATVHLDRSRHRRLCRPDRRTQGKGQRQNQ